MKRFTGIIILYLMSLVGLAAQSGAKIVTLRNDEETPKISISRMKWGKENPHPAAVDYKPKPITPDATQPNDDFRKPPVDLLASSRRRAIYWYQALFKNEGSKKIKGIVWEYVFLDLENKSELGRLIFFDLKQIGASKAVNVTNKAFTPPSNVVTFESLEKNKRSPYLEKSELRCVLYDDNSLWKRPDLSTNDCEVYNLQGKVGWKQSLKN